MQEEIGRFGGYFDCVLFADITLQMRGICRFMLNFGQSRPFKTLLLTTKIPSPSSARSSQVCKGLHHSQPPPLNSGTDMLRHSELEATRELSQVHQVESQTQANQAAAALTLSKKLQSTATKNQAKTIDLEIKRLDAAQAREVLSIIQVCFCIPVMSLAHLDCHSAIPTP